MRDPISPNKDTCNHERIPDWNRLLRMPSLAKWETPDGGGGWKSDSCDSFDIETISSFLRT